MYYREELVEQAVEQFYQSFGHKLNWDERQLLHEIKEYFTIEQLLEFITP